MKKIMMVLLALVLCLPVFVFADEKVITPHIDDKPINEVTNSDGTITRTYEITISTKGNPTIEENGLKMQFEFGKAIKAELFTCGNSSNGLFSVIPDTQNAACIFTPNDTTKALGEKEVLGTLTVTIDKSFPDDDCSIGYMLGDAKGKINPKTGASLPMLYVLGGVAVAGVIFYSTKKKAKFSNI